MPLFNFKNEDIGFGALVLLFIKLVFDFVKGVLPNKNKNGVATPNQIIILKLDALQKSVDELKHDLKHPS